MIATSSRKHDFLNPVAYAVVLVAMAILPPTFVSAQILQYPIPHLESVFPAGGRPGETIDIELRGQDGVTGGVTVVVDGPPGVSVEKVEAAGNNFVKATLKISADAPLGRRMLRVISPRAGMTNFRYFFVGSLPEVVEKEPNNTVESAHDVTLPIVINARVSPTLDVDHFRFAAKEGQKLVAAIVAYGMDSIQNTNKGYLDANIELIDASGKVIAAADDTLGLDPLLSTTIPADGNYTLVVKSLQYLGSDHAVYRLTIGDVPYPTSLFPAGGRIGDSVSVEVDGAHVETGTRQSVNVIRDGTIQSQFAAFEAINVSGVDLPFVRGMHPEMLEVEPNNERSQATTLAVPGTANGRFTTSNDEDWYRMALKKDEGVRFEVASQRFINSPVDSLLEVFDASGKKLSENDDGPAYGGNVQCAHDFISNDSCLNFRATSDGDYFVRIRDLNGSAGSRSVYRLTVEPLLPDFRLYQWPDAVPIWGPGTTAALIVEVLKWNGLQSDIAVRVEGLPPGWKGSVANWPMSWYGSYDGNGVIRLLLTISAPADAAVGTIAPFRIIGRTEQAGRVIEREAQYMTLYGNAHNDRMHVRASPQARAVIAEQLDTSLETMITEISVVEGQTVNIPAKIHRRSTAPATLGVVINGPTAAASVAWRAPLTLTPDQSEITVPLTVNDWKAGDYDIVVARSWSSDIRGGRPGPCTPLIRLHILPAK